MSAETAARPTGALQEDEELRVTEETGDTRLCRIRVSEEECWGCVAMLLDGDQRATFEYVALASNAYPQLLAEVERLREALVEERARSNWRETGLPPRWEGMETMGPSYDAMRERLRDEARAELRADGLLP